VGNASASYFRDLFTAHSQIIHTSTFTPVPPTSTVTLVPPTATFTSVPPTPSETPDPLAARRLRRLVLILATLTVLFSTLELLG
jgi:hypothetical protein